MSTNRSTFNSIIADYIHFKETSLFGRYINTDHILPLLKNLEKHFQLDKIGKSNLGEDIFSIQLGSGKTKILLWSQMHGNESTTTKAVFDLLNVFLLKKEDVILKEILATCSLYIIPILNPDGARAYTRVNANEVDLNRDAKELKQVESNILRDAFNLFQPDFCFNLHDQRSIFSAGDSKFPATLSFLTPSMDVERSVQPSREISMKLIAAINEELSEYIPEQVGRYDDGFNANCTGDTFQSLEVPTVLFEAGHTGKDYEREKTREYVFIAMLAGLNAIATNSYKQFTISDYFEIPENGKLFYDVLLRNAKVKSEIVDIAIQFKEILKDGKITFLGSVENIAPNLAFFGHQEIDCKFKVVTLLDKTEISENVIADKILLNNEILMINYEIK